MHADQSRLGATTMLFLPAISEAKEAGAEELDLGRSPLDNQGRLLYGHIGLCDVMLLKGLKG